MKFPLLMVFSLLTVPLQAATPQAMQAVNLDIVTRQVVPGYRHFEQAAESFASSAATFCEQPAEPGLEGVKEAYEVLLDAWMRSEHWQFGAIEYGLRRERIWFWPDKRGRSGKQLGAALAQADPAILPEDAFAYASVALQGLTAAERLLYGDKVAAEIEAQPYRCDLLRAIAGNMVHLGGEILADWQREGDGDLAILRGAEQGNDTYSDPAAVTARLLASLRNPLVRIHQLKLSAPMGESADQARPRRAESWRSGRGIANLRANIAGLASLYGNQSGQGLRALLSADRAELDLAIAKRFDDIRAVLEELPAEAFADPAHRPALEDLLAKVRKLEKTVEKSLPDALGVPLGFNSLDGD